MALIRFTHASRVAAPLAEVWALHATVDGLRVLTPGWARLRVEAVAGPDGERDPERLPPGTRVELSVRPFGLGPRRHWTSVITLRERGPGRARFRDVLSGGPLDHWEHSHCFYADGDETVVRDRVTCDLPLGDVGDAVARVGLAAFFRDRHRRIREHVAP